LYLWKSQIYAICQDQSNMFVILSITFIRHYWFIFWWAFSFFIQLIAINSLQSDLGSQFVRWVRLFDLSEGFLWRRQVLNFKCAHLLWTNVNLREVIFVSWWRFDLLFEGFGQAFRSGLQRTPLIVLMNAMYTLQICLGDFDFVGHVTVHFHVQVISEVIQVHWLGQIKLSQRLHIWHIKSIGQVLESDENLVLCQWEQSVTALVGHALTELLGELE
jgi:hypothetical protein